MKRGPTFSNFIVNEPIHTKEQLSMTSVPNQMIDFNKQEKFKFNGGDLTVNDYSKIYSFACVKMYRNVLNIDRNCLFLDLH